MCGRYALVLVGDIEIVFEADIDPLSQTAPELQTLLFQDRYNVAPTQQVLTIVTQDGRRKVRPMRWGLIPSWSKDGDRLPLNINARDDSVARSGIWRGPLKQSRCVVPASGFYEWGGPKGSRQAHFIRPTRRQFFAFAGLYDRWVHPKTGEVTFSCAIITARANQTMAPIHDRMPAVLDEEQVAAWLDPAVQDATVLLSMLKPCPASDLEVVRVGPGVGDVHNDSPDLIVAMPEAQFAL